MPSKTKVCTIGPSTQNHGYWAQSVVSSPNIKMSVASSVGDNLLGITPAWSIRLSIVPKLVPATVLKWFVHKICE